MLFNFLVALILFQSCTITPRFHSIGYQIEWRANRLKHEKNERNTSIAARGNETRDLHNTALSSAKNLEAPEELGNYNLVESAKTEHRTTQTTNNCKEKNRIHPSVFRLTPSSEKTLFMVHPTTTKLQNKHNVNQLQSSPDDPWKTILAILGIILTIFGGGSYYDGGGGGGGGGGIDIDWTAFFAIASIVIATTGLVLLFAMKSSMSLMSIKAMVLFFTLFDLPFSVIGFIKSINNYYDAGKYLTIASWVFSAAMLIIGLL